MSDPALIAWALAALLQHAPPERHERAPWADPSPAYAIARYTGIAVAIADVCDGAQSERDCAALLSAIAIGESALARDADEGPCYRLGGYRTRCDSGAAASVWQAHAFGVDEHGERITISRLFADRRLAAWQALRVARASLAMCRSLPAVDRLSGLSGRCIEGPGPWRARMRLYQTLRGWTP